MSPIDVATFHRSRLEWRELAEPQHAARLDWYRRMLTLRREVIAPLLPRIQRRGSFDHKGEAVFSVEWTVQGTGRLHLAANFSSAATFALPAAAGNVLWTEGTVEPDGLFEAYTVRWSLGPP